MSVKFCWISQIGLVENSVMPFLIITSLVMVVKIVIRDVILAFMPKTCASVSRGTGVRSVIKDAPLMMTMGYHVMAVVTAVKSLENVFASNSGEEAQTVPCAVQVGQGKTAPHPSSPYPLVWMSGHVQ